MAIDSTLRQHEEKVKREQQDEEVVMRLHFVSECAFTVCYLSARLDGEHSPAA